jgi:hypothetical protein
MNTKLTIDDIADVRAYERERAAFRERVIALKKRRRVPVGDLVTFVFENRDTIRFQIQEMARVEKLISDEAIEGELRTYNPLIPEAGQLSATMFIELTSKEALVEWLPKLAGVERAVALRFGDERVPAELEAAHAEQLTRDDMTASVHYLTWRLTPEQVEAFASAPAVELVIDHPEYQHATAPDPETVAELATDLRGG